jgi:hypothetical protein
MTERQRSCLDLTEDQFHSLSRRSHPITVDGRDVSRDLPARPVGLAELRVIMLKRLSTDQLKDAVWSYLAQMTRTDPDPWMIAAAGMMLPGLKSIAARLHACYPYDASDLDSEILEAFLRELGRLDPDRPALHTQLYLAAWRRGYQTCRREVRRAARYVPSRDRARRELTIATRGLSVYLTAA